MPLQKVSPRVVERTVLASSLTLMVACAWLALWRSDIVSYGFAHHVSGSHQHHTPGSPPLVFVGGWVLMAVAMMLPTTLPLIFTFHAAASGQRDRLLLVALVIAGYLATWTSFGALVHVANRLLERVMLATPAVAARADAGGPLLLLLAGMFQFSSVKYRCLDHCRSPRTAVTEHWRGHRGVWSTFQLGVSCGVYCVGCCWALMLLMFAGGAGSLGWMALLAVLMVIEKNASWGRRVSAPLGIVLIAGGAVLLYK